MVEEAYMPLFSKIPKTLYMSDFKDEYGDMVSLLIKIINLEKATQFEDWMFYFIEEVSNGKNIHWEKILSENIDS